MSPSRIGTISLVAILFVAPAFAAKPAKKKSAAPKSAARCSFAHYPIAVGDINDYRTTSIQFDAEKKVLQTISNTYSEEVTVLEAGHYRTRSVSEGNTSESEWLCGDEGIEMKFAEYPGTKITTTGVAIPAEMKVGGVWNQTFESASPGSRQVSKTVNRITKREEVVVPAGTFDAYRVEYEVETTIPDQAPSYARGTQWFAPDVGMVKSTSVINMEQGEIRSIETTIELMKRTSK